MTEKVIVPCGSPLKDYSIGIFNRVKVMHVPIGIQAYLSFKNTPKNNEFYPLSDLIEDLDEQGDLVSEPRECFLHLDGISDEDIILYCSNTSNESYVNVEMMREVLLDASTRLTIEQLDAKFRLAIEDNRFTPNGQASQHTISDGNVTEIETSHLIAIQVHCSSDVGMELNNNGVKFPIQGTQEIFLRDVSIIKFHNLNADDVTISILYMGAVIAEEETTPEEQEIDLIKYVLDGFVEDDYVSDTPPPEEEINLIKYVLDGFVENDYTVDVIPTENPERYFESDYVEDSYFN